MKAINDLYDALRKHREERRIRRAIGHLEPHIARDIGFEFDTRRYRRI